MVSVPLFAGYVFAKVELAGKLQFQILNIPGVAGFVGNSRGPTPIPTTEIETVRQVLSKDLSCTPCVFLQVGDRVRVKRGPLLGVEGILVRTGAQSRLVIGVELIYRSMLVTISELDVEPLRPQMQPVFADSWQMNQIRA
jgi:transcription antitermination factor NusG